MYNPGPAIAIVTQPTRMEGLLARWATRGAAKFRLKQMGIQRALAAQQSPGRTAPSKSELQVAEQAGDEDYMFYAQEEDAQKSALDQLRGELDLGVPLKFVDRAYLPMFDFRGCVVAVVIGRDGLVANAAKYVGDVPIVAVNPDPQKIDGVLLPFQAAQARQAVQGVLLQRAKICEVTLAEVNLNDGQRMLAFNDFFIGSRSHVSARYVIRFDNKSESQSSSGMIVSTGAGSSGWLSSVFNMAEGFAQWSGGSMQKRIRLSWEDRRLVWVVREPFRSKQSGVDMVAGLLEQGQELSIESLMPEGGVVFSDGVEADFLEFTSGTIASIGVAKQRAKLVVA